MKRNTNLTLIAGRLLAGTAMAALAAGGALAQSLDDEIVVTSQRTEQSLQDVPISVSAFNGDDLKARQLESFSDIQFNVPNFQFSRSQFTNSNVAIRGIGNFLVASSSEDSVSVHMNDVYLSAPRLFETEFFDVERLEILRGPQGTLFGRNATGGVINVITNKASPDGYSGYVDGEYGNYNSAKVQGAINVPLGDRLAVRLAGITIQRDGYTDNVWTGKDIDDRNIYSLRGSVRWLPTDNTTIDFTANYMREDDNRMRWQKQACEPGPQAPLLGCDPNGPRAYGSVDLRASIAADISSETFQLITGNPAAGAFGVYSLAGGPITGIAQPSDPRKVAMDTDPKYDAEESIFLVNVKHDFENFSFKLNAGYGNSKIATQTDYDGGVGPLLTVPYALGLPAAYGGLPGVYALYSDGTFPVSDFDVGITGSNGLVGTIGGNIQSRSNRYQAVDLSIGERDYWSVEGIVTTDFDGPLNFLFGASHLKTNGFANYAVGSSSLDYFSIVAGTLAAVGAGVPNAANTGYSFYTPYFYNDSEDDFLNSTSAFGEVYFDISDTLRLTGGVRHNWDTKGLRDRGNLFDSFIALSGGTLPAGVTPFVPLGTPSVRALLDSDETTQGTAGAVNDYRVIESDFNATTGRAVLQWTPTDNVQFYASWSRGYKPGGFNPRTLIPGVPKTFDPEVINAYEAGVKSTLADGKLQANLTGFYYDYSGLQVSRIVSRTSINENIDATIWGLEGEFVWRPVERWTFNMNASYLKTKAGAFSTFDPHNPTAGRTDVELVADITDGSNCVVTRGASDNPLLLSNGGAPLAGPLAALNPLIASPYSVCSQLAANIGTVNLLTGSSYDVVGGVDQDLEGNRLIGSPKFKIAGGVQYDIPVSGKYQITPRVDAYYQSNMYTDLFNSQQSLIDGYAYVNAQISFAPTEGSWYFRAFMQNVTNNDALTGAYKGDQSSGTSQNIFILEPRRWGVGIGYKF